MNTYITDEGHTIRSAGHGRIAIRRLIESAATSREQAQAYEEIVEALQELRSNCDTAAAMETYSDEINRNYLAAREMWEDEEWRLSMAEGIADHFGLSKTDLGR